MQTSLSLEFWLILFVISVVIVGIIYVFSLLKKREEKKTESSYMMALKYMAEGENRRAVEMFKEAVRHNSENIDAYIKLGVILRNEKLYKNAIRIHKDLLFRGKITPEQRNEIKYHLALDYLKAGQEDSALEHLESLKNDKKYENIILTQLLSLYESKGLWDKAIETIKSSTNSKNDEIMQKLASYKVEKGKQIAESGNGKEARIIFKDALKIDPACSKAYLLIGDSYIADDRTDDAISTWTDFCKNVPDAAYLSFGRLEKAWYEKGQFSKIEDLYISMLEKNENDIHAVVRISEIYRKKGDFKSALKYLYEAQKNEAITDILEYEIIKVLYDKGQYKEASNKAIKLGEKNYKLDF